MKPFPRIKRRAVEFLKPMTLFPHPKKQPDLPMTNKSVKQYFFKMLSVVQWSFAKCRNIIQAGIDCQVETAY